MLHHPYRQSGEPSEQHRHVRPFKRHLGVTCGHHFCHLEVVCHGRKICIIFHYRIYTEGSNCLTPGNPFASIHHPKKRHTAADHPPWSINNSPLSKEIWGTVSGQTKKANGAADKHPPPAPRTVRCCESLYHIGARVSPMSHVKAIGAADSFAPLKTWQWQRHPCDQRTNKKSMRIVPTSSE